MGYSRLVLFLEGVDDRQFFDAILTPLFEARYDHVLVVLVSRLAKKRIAEWLRGVQGMGADYIYVRDLDRFRCTSAAKKALQRKFPRVDPARIQIVKAEIESWYCAGIPKDSEMSARLMASGSDSEQITKERLNSVVRASRSDALDTILEQYDLRMAAQRSSSLRYFLKKFLGMEM